MQFDLIISLQPSIDADLCLASTTEQPRSAGLHVEIELLSDGRQRAEEPEGPTTERRRGI